jgi:hypothetical protein
MKKFLGLLLLVAILMGCAYNVGSGVYLLGPKRYAISGEGCSEKQAKDLALASADLLSSDRGRKYVIVEEVVYEVPRKGFASECPTKYVYEAVIVLE